MSDFIFSGFVVGVLIIMFYTPYMLAKGVWSLEDDMTVSQHLVCLIPIYNIIKAEKMYKGKYGFVTFSTVFSFVAIIIRVFIWYTSYNNVTMSLVSLALFWGAILIFCIANISFVYLILSDADAVAGLPLLLYSLAFPFGQFYIGAYLSNVIKHKKVQEDTFKR